MMKNVRPLSDDRLKYGRVLSPTQAEQEPNARYHYLETVQAISQSILEASDIKNILDELLEKTMAVGGFDLGNIRLLNTTGKIIGAAYRGYRDPEKARRRHSGTETTEKRLALREVTESGRILIIDDLSNESRMKGFKEEGAQSGVAFPLATHGDVYGVLALATRSRRQFHPAEVRLLESIGAQIGIGVQKSRLLEETRRNLRQLRLLQEIMVATTYKLDLLSMLSMLLEKVSKVYPAEVLSIVFHNAQTGGLEPMNCRNLPQEEWTAFVQKMSVEQGKSFLGSTQGLSGGAESTPINIGDLQTEPNEVAREFARKHGLVSCLALPLIGKEKPIGQFVIITKRPHKYSNEEVEFLTSLASQAAVAIDNAILYEETKRQAEKLKEASKLQADFSAMIAHDLRSPLYTMIGVVDMMKEGLVGILNAEQKNWLDRVRNNAMGLVNLVSDFLDVSGLESGHINLSRTVVHMKDLVNNTIENFRPLAKSKNVALSWDEAGAIPPVHADARRLDQVLSNLLSNGLKFTGQGGTIQVRIRSENKTGVRIDVQDSGVGIPRAEIANLFQKYRQVNSLTIPAQKGTGLGLVICKMIVEAHGGKIWVESEERNGATFIFTLPLDSQPHREDSGYLVAPNR